MREHSLRADLTTNLHSRHHVGHAHLVLCPQILEIMPTLHARQRGHRTGWALPGRGLLGPSPGSCVDSVPQVQTGGARESPSCDSQQRMVAATTECTQWGAAGERPQGLQPAPGCPKGEEWSALLNCHCPFRGFVSCCFPTKLWHFQ